MVHFKDYSGKRSGRIRRAYQLRRFVQSYGGNQRETSTPGETENKGNNPRSQPDLMILYGKNGKKIIIGPGGIIVTNPPSGNPLPDGTSSSDKYTKPLQPDKLEYIHFLLKR